MHLCHQIYHKIQHIILRYRYVMLVNNPVQWLRGNERLTVIFDPEAEHDVTQVSAANKRASHSYLPYLFITVIQS